MEKLSAREVARRYVSEIEPTLATEIAGRPDWQEVVKREHEGMANRLFVVLTRDMVVREQVPQIGVFMRVLPESYHLPVSQVEAAVMRILSLACARWRYAGSFSLTDTLAAIDKMKG